MKQITLALSAIILLSVSVFSQQFNYKEQWAKVEKIRSDGMPKEALKTVETIYNKAKQEKNFPEFFKSVVFQISLTSEFDENRFENALAKLDKEIAITAEPNVQILHSAKAQILWSYYESNRYKFLNRSTTINYNKNDIETWDLRSIVQEVFNEYHLSLKNEALLKRTSLNNYEQILTEGSNSRKFRPTLYDFLAHRALDFFAGEEPQIVKPALSFYINNPAFLSNSETFINTNFITPDSLSMKYYALKLLQNLTKFHLADANPTALIDIELKRLQFVKNNASFANIDSLYLNSLLNLYKNYKSNEYSTDIAYQIGLQYCATAAKYDPVLKPQYKFDYTKALNILNEATTNFPKAEGNNNCQYLKKNIESPTLTISNEDYVVANKPFRALINYKNSKKVFIRIIPIDKDENVKLQNELNKEKLLQKYISLPYKNSASFNLPDDNDYQQHSVEVNLPAIEKGYYIILTSSTENFDVSKDYLSFTDLWSTKLAFNWRANKNGTIEIAVINRETGTPIENAEVEAKIQKYNYSTRKYEYKIVQKGNSDAEGRFIIEGVSTEEYSRSIKITIKKDDDKIVSGRDLYQYKVDTTEKSSTQTYFFTDRAIYRPGQTVFFKGIMVEYIGKTSKIISNKQTNVEFLDVNWQVIAKQTLTSNDYGSFSGSFIAPNGVLNGQMHISNKHGYTYFRVEEYKRPKFEVKFNSIKGSYRLNEDVSVVGLAKAYAGNAIDGAKVKYRVTRKTTYPWWSWWWDNLPYSPEMEIINGETTTNEKGEFTIKFNAIPDYSIHKDKSPVFNYAVSVDVSDINGETHPSTTNVSVGYISMFAQVSLPENINQLETPNKYDIRTTNLNGQLEPTTISVTIHKLKQPDRILNSRFWAKPDKFILQKDDFYKLFPYDVYNDELEKKSWEIEAKIFDKNLNTATDTILEFNDILTWSEGYYIIEIKGKDKYGEAFEKSQLFSVINSNSANCSKYEHLQLYTDKNSSEPGKSVQISVASKHNNAKVLLEVDKDGKIIYKQWITLNSNKQNIQFPITAEHYGTLTIHATLNINNRAYTKTTNIYVPKFDTKLNVTFETFRDKLQPGQEEEWKIKISGEKGEKIAAELLASMYDASLDAFVQNYWSFYLNNYYSKSIYWDISDVNGINNANSYYIERNNLYPKERGYEHLNWFDYYIGYGSLYEGNYRNGRGGKTTKTSITKVKIVDNSLEVNEKSVEKEEAFFNTESISKMPCRTAEGIAKEDNDDLYLIDETGSNVSQPIQMRSNFNETAFFMPQLTTDAEGNIVLKFKVPESLTRWKVMGLAHSKDLRIGQFTKELVTQKELMVVPNQPRFFRENDKMDFTVKISNISDKDLAGIAKVEFFDALNMKPINSNLGIVNNEISFNTAKGQSTSVAWNITIPQGIMAITYRVSARANNFSDGEEMTLPVLTNRMLVTESLPLPINGNQTKNFSFDKLKNNTSTTLTNFKYTLEFTINPAWYAIQALPYLMEYPYECSEQMFSRFYANSIATHIANSSPKIKAVFESWKINSPEALISNLSKNQELKSLMLEETPWVLDAQNETEQKKRIGLLFDIINMSNQLSSTLEKLQKMQTSNGGWPWFAGMPDNQYITQYIVTGFGHLKNLGIANIKSDSKTWSMVSNAVRYLDNRIRERYEELKRWKVDMSKNQLSSFDIQYLYARTYFIDEIEVESKNSVAYTYFLNQSKKYWLNNSIYLQGLIALANYRTKDNETAKKIIASIKDKALYSEEMGMYWRDNSSGYYWYEAPIETQALLIEAFDVVNNDLTSVEKMKIWLLKQKQTQNWSTTKSTAEACYALLLRGTNQLTDDKLVEVKIGNKVIDPKKMDNVKVEAGTGYFKTAWNGTEIKPEMANISVTKSTEGVAWGCVYWQYFENLDKITPAKTPLNIKKELFVVRQTATGDVIEPISANSKIKVGDKIKVRIELRSDRDMEYVHMKDMRAAAFEPINVLSAYKYQDGLGYYESTRDAATNFFFDYLRKGTYVFEYTMFATQKGNFSNGITTIQCMYAPEFTSHSEGIRVDVE